MSKQAAKVVTKVLWPVFALKLLSLAGSTASTLGVVTFFFFETLAPYRWWLIIGGIALSLSAIFAERALMKKWAAETADEDV